MTHRTLEQLEQLMKNAPAGRMIPVTSEELTMLNKYGYSVNGFEVKKKDAMRSIHKVVKYSCIEGGAIYVYNNPTVVTVVREPGVKLNAKLVAGLLGIPSVTAIWIEEDYCYDFILEDWRDFYRAREIEEERSKFVEQTPTIIFDNPSFPNTKPSNPKDVVGIMKAPLSTLSAPVLAEVGVAMLEGALKYGRHNYRVVGVRASVYYDATQRHLLAWWEGEDIDPSSKLSHVTKAIASLFVLRDAMIQKMLEDDRPPASEEFYAFLNERVEELHKMYADRNPTHYTQANCNQIKEL